VNWKLKTVKLTEIKEYEANPRKITEKGLKDLKDSISNFGQAEPLVVNTDMTLIGGHARKLAMESLDFETCQIAIPDKKLTDKQVQELNIRLNKNIAGEFDFDKLGEFFETDDLTDWGFENWELGEIEDLGTEFSLPSGEKEPFQQMTFTLADAQAELIKEKIANAKKESDFNELETFGNENSNGNALYYLING
jgi:hypothetical protein